MQGAPPRMGPGTYWGLAAYWALDAEKTRHMRGPATDTGPGHLGVDERPDRLHRIRAVQCRLQRAVARAEVRPRRDEQPEQLALAGAPRGRVERGLPVPPVRVGVGAGGEERACNGRAAEAPAVVKADRGEQRSARVAGAPGAAHVVRARVGAGGDQRADHGEGALLLGQLRGEMQRGLQGLKRREGGSVVEKSAAAARAPEASSSRPVLHGRP